jgi:hypothetical protein
MTDPLPYTHGTTCDKSKESKTVEMIKVEDPSARGFRFTVDPVSGRTSITYTSDKPLPPQPKGI